MQTATLCRPGGVDLEVHLAARFVDRWRGLRPRAQGRSLLVRRNSVHGIGMREPLTVIGIDRAGTVIAVRLLRPWRIVTIRGADLMVETPVSVPPPAPGDRVEIRCSALSPQRRSST